MGTETRPTRRLLLKGAAVAGAGVAVGGCTAFGPDDAAGPAADPATTAAATGGGAAGSDSDVGLVEAAAADERALLEYCLKAANSHPDLAPTLGQLVDQQRTHAAALTAALTDPGPTRVGRVPPVHGDRGAVLRTVRRLLVQARSDRRSDALTAHSGPLARLFASMSASHAVAAGLGALHR